MTSGVEKDANFEIGSNSNVDDAALNPSDEQILVESAQQTTNGDGSGGKDGNLNSGSKTVDNGDSEMELDANATELGNRVSGLELSQDMKTLPENPLAIVSMDSEIGDGGYHFDSPEDGYETGTEEEQSAFRKEVEAFYKERYLEFKAPKFYKEDLNLLKLWRAVIKLGGYEQVTAYKLWRKVGESFNPPKTCTTVSWTFRIFYEKALLDYEKYKMPCGEFPLSNGSKVEGIENQAAHNPAPGTGRARRDAANRAMQGWHSRRVLDSGEVCHPVMKDKNSSSIPKSDKLPNSAGLLKRKSQSVPEQAPRFVGAKGPKPNFDDPVVDVGQHPADWVKVNVHRVTDGFEIFALVPGLLREEVHVQTDPAGRLIISGEPKELDNPWGVTPFKKVVTLPSRIDASQVSAIVTMHGQLFIRVPFEQSET